MKEVKSRIVRTMKKYMQPLTFIAFFSRVELLVLFICAPFCLGVVKLVSGVPRYLEIPNAESSEVLLYALGMAALLGVYIICVQVKVKRLHSEPHVHARMVFDGLCIYLYGALFVIASFALAFSEKGVIKDGSARLNYNYLDALYLSFITWTTVGYGDTLPSTAAKPFAAMEAFIGYCYMAMSIGHITNLLGASSDSDDRAE